MGISTAQVTDTYQCIPYLEMVMCRIVPLISRLLKNPIQPIFGRKILLLSTLNPERIMGPALFLTIREFRTAPKEVPVRGIRITHLLPEHPGRKVIRLTELRHFRELVV